MRAGALIDLPCQETSWTISNNGGSALLICTMQDGMGMSALRFGNNGSSVTKPDGQNFGTPCDNSLLPSEQNSGLLNLYCRKCWQPRPTSSTAWISSWPNSTANPPPEQIPNRHFIGKRSLKGPAFEKSYERQLRTRRLRSNYDGCWYTRVFPTVEEADEYVRQEAEKKAAKRAERKAKRMVRMERWLGERLGVEKPR